MSRQRIPAWRKNQVLQQLADLEPKQEQEWDAEDQQLLDEATADWIDPEKAE